MGVLHTLRGAAHFGYFATLPCAVGRDCLHVLPTSNFLSEELPGSETSGEYAQESAL